MNLISALSQVPHNDQAFLVALLEEITLNKMLRVQVRDFHHWLRRSVSHPPLSADQSVQEPDWSKAIEARQKYWATQSPDLCFVALIRQSRLRVDDNHKAFDPDTWMRTVIRRAALPWNLKNDQPLDRLIPQIVTRCVEHLAVELERQAPEVRTQWENRLDTTLGHLTDQERSQLLTMMGVEELTGKALLDLCRTGGLTTSVLTMVHATGFGVYTALTTVIHALATTLLGITVPMIGYLSATTLLSTVLSPLGGLALIGLLTGMQLWTQKKRLVGQIMTLVIVLAYTQPDCSGDDQPPRVWDGWRPEEYETLVHTEQEEKTAQQEQRQADRRYAQRYAQWQNHRHTFQKAEHAYKRGEETASNIAQQRRRERASYERQKAAHEAYKAAKIRGKMATDRLHTLQHQRIQSFHEHLQTTYPSLTVLPNVVADLATHAIPARGVTVERRLSDIVKCPALARLGGWANGRGPRRLALGDGGTLDLDPNTELTVVTVV